MIDVFELGDWAFEKWRREIECQPFLFPKRGLLWPEVVTA
jgi:hypothetical protein